MILPVDGAERPDRPDQGMARGVLILCLLLAALYGPTLAQGFHFDDSHMVVGNQYVKSWDLLPKTFWTDAISSAGVVKGMYRPVLMASFAWNYHWGGLNPIGFHLTNVWLHLLVVCLAVGLVRRIWPQVRPGWVLAGVALWALHPIHSQAVAYLSARSVLLTALFLLLALWLYTARSSPVWLCRAGSWLAFALALGTKEIAVTFVGLLVLIEWLLWPEGPGPGARPRGQAPIRRLAPFLILTGLYLVWRKVLIGSVGVVFAVRPWTENFLMQWEAIGSYLRLWLWPTNLSVVHPQPAGTVAGAAAAAAGVAGLGFLAWRVRQKWPGWMLAFAWAAITFLPMALASSLNLIVSEHHAYWPSVGIALGLPPLLQALSRGRERGMAVVCILLAGLYSVAALQRVFVWRDELSLWSDAVRKAPKRQHAQSNLGLAYENQGRLEEAYLHYARSLPLAATGVEQSTSLNNLGSIYLKTSQPKEALAFFQQGMELNPYDHSIFHNNLGLAHLDLGDPTAAEKAFRKALEEDPWMVEAHLNLAALLLRAERIPEAGRHFERAFMARTDRTLPALALGRFYILEGKWDQARKVFERLTAIAPRMPEGYLYLAVCTLRLDGSDGTRADRYLERAKGLGWQPDPVFLEELHRLKMHLAQKAPGEAGLRVSAILDSEGD